MLSLILLYGGLVVGSVSDDGTEAAKPPSSAVAPLADLSAYEALKGTVGRDAEAHVRLALWCEAHGLDTERVKHLAKAVLLDPSNATARGLVGLVAFRGKWVRPEKVAETVKADPALAAATDEYLKRRAKTPDTADAQSKLATWCEENGLHEQSVAHLRAVVRLDPSRESAWKRLGYKKVGKTGRWATPEQIAAAKSEADAQKQADRHWTPILERWRTALEGKSKPAREAAETAMAGLNDPRAVPAVWSTFLRGENANRQLSGLGLLSQIDAPASTQSLAMLAIGGSSPEVRRRATETLRRRDPRDYADLLANLMRKLIKYKMTPVGGPGQTGTLLVEGEKANSQRRYTPPSLPDLSGLFNNRRGVVWTTDANGLPVALSLTPGSSPFSAGYVAQDGSYALVGQPGTSFGGTGPGTSDLGARIANDPAHAAQALARPNPSQKPNGVPTLNRGLPLGAFTGSPGGGVESDVGQAFVETQRAAVAARQQLENDVRALEQYNTDARDLNRKVVDVINSAAGQNLDPDPENCRRWATDQLGYAYRSDPDKPKPTVVQNVPLNYQLPPVSGLSLTGNGYGTTPPHNACFGAGTRVHTRSGLAAIEGIRAGDLVLARDVKTGALSYQPVVTAYHNPPNATLKVGFEVGESVVVTGIHRFWKAGKGWTMARDLKPGDVIRTVGGSSRVESVVDDTTQPVFNLEVAEGQSFFVGKAGLLVHDNSLVNPEPRPFDAAAVVKVAAAR